MDKYDVIIIGAGPGGMAAASSIKQAGKSVAVIENDLWGGTCPNRGCDPKKVLLSGVQARDKIEQLQGKGFENTPFVNWKEIQAFKRTFTDPVSESSRKSLDNMDIKTIVGNPKFISDNEIDINDEILSANNFIIATGQRSHSLNISGNQYLLDSADFLALDEMPKEITFIGAGYISFELAVIASSTGARVHIVHHNDKPLKAFDPDMVSSMMEQMKKRNIEFHFNINTQEITQDDSKYTLHADNFELNSDLIFDATGRIPNTENLDLETANVTYDRHGIQTNEFLQTSNPIIFAIGDVLAKKQPKLTPVSGFEARYVTDYLLGKNTAAIQYPVIPTVVYGGPELAQIGVPVEEAQKDSSMTVKDLDTTNWFTYHRSNDPVAKIKTVINNKNQIVGASILSSDSSEFINLFTTFINSKTPINDILNQVMAYPTSASDLEYLI
ncbi:dihydrolipoyl dehydrogenase family protein [Companilactobacillus metriopterae]|uniref:dihydrolipoyl dehydrogenase family protein n=1 Tax=Companilactobacillus metriopterae TaxID=1909267 RepID=UPI00100C2479|nr:NAD(P)/FAD-dependent oxidoreductase [Companilactobacillus metriopterae]